MRHVKHNVPCPHCLKLINPDWFRFMTHVEIQPSGCWLWVGSHDTIWNGGYGRFELHEKWMGAHRASFIIFKGPIPAGLDICHTCIGNRRCVNPEHLYAGTEKQNIRDTIQQGRKKTPKGSLHRCAKLDENTVFRLRFDPKSEPNHHTDFGVSYRTLWKAKAGKTWKHVPMP